MATLVDLVLESIAELQLEPKKSLTELDPSKTLKDHGLDSLDIVEIMMLLEEKTGTKWTEDQFKLLLYDTVFDVSEKLYALLGLEKLHV